MTRLTSARIAGATFLLYIAVALPANLLYDAATKAESMAATLTRVAEHAPDVRIAILLSLLSCFSAVVLAVTLYGITRDQDHELATLGLACRVGEGVIIAVGIVALLGMLWLGTTADARRPDSASAHAIGAFLLQLSRWTTLLSAIFFAVGSTAFAYLLFRGRMVPRALGGLGVVASVLLVVLLPLRLAGMVNTPMFELVWAPMALFEIGLALWFLVKGVRAPAQR